jgi:hypothetical protein
MVNYEENLTKAGLRIDTTGYINLSRTIQKNIFRILIDVFVYSVETLPTGQTDNLGDNILRVCARLNRSVLVWCDGADVSPWTSGIVAQELT